MLATYIYIYYNGGSYYREFTSLFVRGYLAIRFVFTYYTSFLSTCMFYIMYEMLGHTVRKYAH